MRRDLSQPLYTLDGAPIVKAEGGGPAPLYTYCLDALMASYKDEATLTGKQKVERYQLALKINKRPAEVDFTAEQLTLLKELLARAFGPLVVGQAYEVLEGETLSLVKRAGALGPEDRPGA